MATYKVIQDIEAEDKLVGPLTLRQFIYAAICLICLYLCFLSYTNGAVIVIPVILPFAFIAGFFAFPWTREQPTEVWALARIRYLIKPRRRIWNQSGVKELVTITAPKRTEHNYSNGLSETEVKSRLRALADTIDSRGWAIKNVSVNMFAQSGLPNSDSSDRLISASTLPHDMAAVDIHESDDMLDVRNNPVAQQFDTMINQAAKAHREEVIRHMNQAQAAPDSTPTNPTSVMPPNNYWFLNQPQPGAPASNLPTQVVAPGATQQMSTPTPATTEPPLDEAALAERLRRQNNTQQISYAHMRTILPIAEQKRLAAIEAQQHPKPAQTSMTHQPDPAIMALASNNDLNVATIARQANKTKEAPDEVVISLH